MKLRLLVWWWNRRLEHARRFVVMLERDQRREMEAARADVAYCEVQRARANMAVVQANADRAVRKRLDENAQFVKVAPPEVAP